MQTEVIYRLPEWATTIALVCVMLAVGCLAIYLAAGAINNFLNAAIKLETSRHKHETKALNKWQALYEHEKALHLQDVSDLSAQLVKAEAEHERAVKEVELIKERLSKIKVVDL